MSEPNHEVPKIVEGENVEQRRSALLEEIAAASKWDDRIARYVDKGEPDAAVMREMVQLRKEELELRIKEHDEQARIAFHEDLLAAQSAAPKVIRRDKGNPGGISRGKGVETAKYSWASLESAVSEIVPIFNAHRFSITHETVFLDDKPYPYLATILEHKLGKQRRVLFPLEPDSSGGKSKPQAHGSPMTYARRYGIAAVCGFATADMNDPDEEKVDLVKVDTKANMKMAEALAKYGQSRADSEAMVGRPMTEWTAEDLDKLRARGAELKNAK